MGLPTQSRILWGGGTPYPDGWSRRDAFDDLYLSGAPNGQPGGATGGGPHTHIDAGHGHAHGAHEHAITCGGDADLGYDRPASDPFGISISPVVHSHASATTAQGQGSSASAAASLDSATAHPSHTRVVVLEPDDAGQEIPTYGIAFADDQRVADNSAFVVVSSFDGQFLRGAASGTGGGGTGGGTHTHGDTTGHTHGASAHSHADSDCGNPTGIGTKCQAITPTGTNDLARHLPHHLITSISQESPALGTAYIVDQAGPSEPAYVELVPLLNSGSAATPNWIIIAFEGQLGDIPADWTLCDGNGGTIDTRDRQIRCTASWANVGRTGGGTHTHTISAHAHAGTAHGHSSTYQAQAETGPGTGADLSKAGHGHAGGFSLGNQTETILSAAVSVSGTDGRAPYRTVVWIKKQPVRVRVNGATIRGGRLAAA